MTVFIMRNWCVNLNDPFVKDEIARIYAKPNYSEFEFTMFGEIGAWSFNQPHQWYTAESVVKSFWKEKLSS